MKHVSKLCLGLLLLSGCGQDAAFQRDLADSIRRIADVIEQELRDGGTQPANPVPELSLYGSYGISVVDPHPDSGLKPYTEVDYSDWGLWGRVPVPDDDPDLTICAAIECAYTTLFRAYVTTRHGETYGVVEGEKSGSSPVSGIATWNGGVRAYETIPDDYSPILDNSYWDPVEGDARLAVDFSAATVDVDFTGFDNDQADISWSALALDNGEFESFENGVMTMEGSFYGSGHQGVAGKFNRDNLSGVFGAVRGSSE